MGAEVRAVYTGEEMQFPSRGEINVGIVYLESSA